MRRLTLLLIVTLGLAPNTWVRVPPPPESTDNRRILAIVPLQVPRADLGEFRLAGAWSLASPNRHFGGYSALVGLPGGTLFAVSDHGRMLWFTPPGRAGHTLRFDYFAQSRAGEKALADVEGLTRDPVGGGMWATLEQRNMIVRYDTRFRRSGRVYPPAMRGWPSNTGPEAITRLADGRFIVLSEGSPRWFDDDLPALLFAADPVAGGAPKRFRFAPPDGFRPVDIAQMPDGRVLILLRKVIWRLPPRFEGKLMLADPAEIREGKPWRGRVVADLAEPLPMDNYEGLAVEPADDGGAVVWLISDDNSARFQRTLLLKLEWRPRGSAAAVRRARRPS